MSKLSDIIEQKFKNEDDYIKKDIITQLQDISTNMIIDMKNLNLEKNICSGGSSIVYKGTYKYLDVAIKKIQLALVNLK